MDDRRHEALACDCSPGKARPASFSPICSRTLLLGLQIVRTPGQASGRSLAPTIDCTGLYSFHFGHAYVENYFLAAGQTIRAQYWSRDPGFAAPNNIGLTDGLSFTLLP